MRNIYRMLEIIVGTHAQRMDKALIEVFDKLTMHYHENRYNVEGWKTNSYYLVNKKFILEGVGENSWVNSGIFVVSFNQTSGNRCVDIAFPIFANYSFWRCAL